MISAITHIARLVRAEVLGVVRREYVAAAGALGAAPGRVLWRHVVPNALGAATVATALGVGNAILLESGLSFLGLGVQPPAPSWGNLIAGGRDLLLVAPWVSLVPGLLLVGTVLACTRLGDALATLRERHARRLVGRRTLVLLVSDGLDTGEPAALAQELAWLKRRSRKLLWLNPLLRFDGYAPLAQGAAVLHRQADAMLAVHNLSRLEQLAGGLAAVIAT